MIRELFFSAPKTVSMLYFIYGPLMIPTFMLACYLGSCLKDAYKTVATLLLPAGESFHATTHQEEGDIVRNSRNLYIVIRHRPGAVRAVRVVRESRSQFC